MRNLKTPGTGQSPKKHGSKDCFVGRFVPDNARRISDNVPDKRSDCVPDNASDNAADKASHENKAAAGDGASRSAARLQEREPHNCSRRRGFGAWERK